MTEDVAIAETRFAAGADVPEWLIAIEPANPRAHMRSMRFQSPVIVYEMHDRFLVLQDFLGEGHAMLAVDASNCRIYAASKPVYLIGMFNVLFPLDVDAWHAQPPPGYPSPALQPPVPQAPEQPRPGLLARLWAAFKG